MLEEAWPAAEALSTPYEWELLGSIITARLWQAPEEDWLATADVVVELIEGRGGPAAADLLETVAAIGPPYLAAAARAAVGRLDVEPRIAGRIGAQELVAAHWAGFGEFRAAILRLARDGSEQIAILTFDPQIAPQVSGLLTRPHAPADAADIYDQQLSAFDEDVLRELGRDEAVALCVMAAENAAEAGHAVAEELAPSLPILARALTGRADGLMWLGEVIPEASADPHHHDHGHTHARRAGDPARSRAKRKAQRAARKRNRRR